MQEEQEQDHVSRDAPWTRAAPVARMRSGVTCGVLGPLMDLYTQREVIGLEHLAALAAPAVFVANHASHMDTPVILRSLPGGWRRRTAIAAAADYFYADRRLSLAVSLAFGTVPLERRGGGTLTGTMALIDQLVADRWSLLVYAEGTRSRDGVVGRLRPGAAVLATEHGLPLVPIHVSGTHETMPAGRRWMARAPGRGAGSRRPVRVRFGAPIHPGPEANRKEVMERVRAFFVASGATTTPRTRSAALAAGPGA